jgi:hypothetical protein
MIFIIISFDWDHGRTAWRKGSFVFFFSWSIYVPLTKYTFSNLLIHS